MAINFGSPTDFHDLCIANGYKVAGTVEAAFRLGYHRVAVETYLREDEIFFPSGKQPGAKNKSKGETEVPREIPVPPTIDVTVDEGEEYNDRKLLHRLTFAMSDASTAYKVSQSKNAKKYDLLSIHPTSAVAFQSACQTQDVDIIQLRMPLDYRPARKMVRTAARRGVVFELLYSGMLWDRSLRKTTIAFAHELYTLSKLKNLIVSSGATKPLDLRGPFDVCNLCELLGFDESNARKCVMANGRAVVLKALGRLTIKGVALVKPASAEGTDEVTSDSSKNKRGTAPFNCSLAEDEPPAKRIKAKKAVQDLAYVVADSL